MPELSDADLYGELIARKYETKVYNIFAVDYHLIATFICPFKCKEWLLDPDSIDPPAWIGVFTANKAPNSAIPMWTPDSFIADYPHKK